MSPQGSTAIRDARERLGMTQLEVARRLGVTRAAVQQYERNEERGAISLATLRSALEVLGGEVVIRAVRRPRNSTLSPLVLSKLGVKARVQPVSEVAISYDASLLDAIPRASRSAYWALWRARSEMFDRGILSIVGEDGLPFSLVDVRVQIAGGSLESGSRDQQAQLRWIIRTYQGMLRAVESSAPISIVSAPDGSKVVPDPSIAFVPERAFEFAARAIASGVNHVTVRTLAGQMLLTAGYDYVMTYATDAAFYTQAVDDLKSIGDATAYMELMAARYEQGDEGVGE